MDFVGNDFLRVGVGAFTGGFFDLSVLLRIKALGRRSMGSFSSIQANLLVNHLQS